MSPDEFSSALQQAPRSFPQDFLPFKDFQVSADGTASVPLAPHAENIVIAEGRAIDWQMKFAANHNSNTMWLLSLEFVGRLLSTFQEEKNVSLFSLASHCIRDFLDFSNEMENREYICNILSNDHSTATRVKVLAKCLATIRTAGGDN